jgi:predicted RNase H-like HicB family nuclease
MRGFAPRNFVSVLTKSTPPFLRLSEERSNLFRNLKPHWTFFGDKAIGTFRRETHIQAPLRKVHTSVYLRDSRSQAMMFHVVLHPEEDGWIAAECPALPGCVSQGKDEKEALANIREAITGWLWAEDQKAADALPPDQSPVLVAV